MARLTFRLRPAWAWLRDLFAGLFCTASPRPVRVVEETQAGHQPRTTQGS